MLEIQDIKHFLTLYPVELGDIVLELRNLIATVAPGCTETIRSRTRSLSYYFGKFGGPVSAGICGIALKEKYVQLQFPHGAFIPDPENLLTGTGKAMRHLVLRSYEHVPWDAVRDLIYEHANFDPRSLTIS
ncbi:MAG: DUF1801 domain-containing protein [Anaerolineaceae bacterium]|nr:DUF1801 domain-containing protein [Anaerolineaceae bacterium]